MQLRLGKRPARPHAYQLHFGNYFNFSKLPKPPAVFGHEGLVSDWQMLGNDAYGDCVFAGAAHEEMLWHREGGLDLPPFDTTAVLENYTEVTGFNPNDPSTDKGTDVVKAAEYRKNTGLLDAAGNRHKVDAFASIQAGHVDHALVAAYLFGAIGIGINVPDTAMDQFQAGEPWDVVPHANIEGGHYVPLVGRNASGNLLVVTWGKIQQMTPAFFQRFCDEVCAYINLDFLKSNVSPEGYNLAQLEEDLTFLT